jgi:hypothetical protein
VEDRQPIVAAGDHFGDALIFESCCWNRFRSAHQNLSKSIRKFPDMSGSRLRG